MAACLWKSLKPLPSADTSNKLMTFANKLRFLQELSINQRTKSCSKIMQALGNCSQANKVLKPCESCKVSCKLYLISTTVTVREMLPLKWNMTTELAPSMSLSCSSESALHNHHNHIIKHSLFTIVVITHHPSTPGRHLSLHLPSMALTKTLSKNGETIRTRLWCH